MTKDEIINYVYFQFVSFNVNEMCIAKMKFYTSDTDMK